MTECVQSKMGVWAVILSNEEEVKMAEVEQNTVVGSLCAGQEEVPPNYEAMPKLQSA